MSPNIDCRTERGDPHTLDFDRSGILWFTVQQSEQRRPARSGDRRDQARHLADAGSRPYGIAINSKGVPFFDEFGTNQIGSIDPKTMEIHEYTLPDPRRARGASRSPATTSSGTPISRAAISAGSIPRPAAAEGVGRRRAVRSPSPTASSAIKGVIWYSELNASPIPSSASIREPKNSRAGRFPAAAISCATPRSRLAAIGCSPTALSTASRW